MAQTLLAKRVKSSEPHNEDYYMKAWRSLTIAASTASRPGSDDENDFGGYGFGRLRSQPIPVCRYPDFANEIPVVFDTPLGQD